jgi:energy-coupling factor transport system substrate-specific component
MGALTLAAVALLLAAGFFFFERGVLSAEKLVLLAVLSAISAVGRGLFAAIPSVQPSSFIIIVSGITLGAASGGIVGMTTALLSSLMLGVGPWTPWQMFAWGLMGLMSGWLSKPLERSKFLRVVYGALWGYLFGWIMTVWTLLTVETTESGWAYVVAVYAASLLFDTFHAAANAALLWLDGGRYVNTLRRIVKKYGIGE